MKVRDWRGWRVEVEGLRLEVRGWRLKRLKVGGWTLEVRRWRLEVIGLQLEVGG